MKNALCLIVTLFIPTLGHAQAIHHQGGGGGGVQEIPQNFSIGNQYYDLNVEGLRKYVDNNPKAADMNSKLKDLESQQKNADIAKWSFVGVGAVMAIGSFTFLQVEEDYEEEGKKKYWNGTAFIGGVAVGILGYWVQRWMQPDREDYLDFINQHNANPDREPLKLNLGWNLEHSGPTLAARYTF